MNTCPVCGAETPADAAACPACGSSVHITPNAPTVIVRAAKTDPEKAAAQHAGALRDAKKRKKILLIIALVIALAAMVVLFAVSRKQTSDTPEEPSETQAPATTATGGTTMNDFNIDDIVYDTLTNVDSTEVSAIPQTTVVPTPADPASTPQTPATPADPSPAAQSTAAPDSTAQQVFNDFVAAIQSRKYAMKGTAVSDGEQTVLGITFYNDKIRMSANFEGKSIDIAIADNQMYMINNEAKTYMIFSAALAKTLKLDLDEMNADEIALEINDAASAVVTDETLNGAAATVYTVPSGTGKLKIFIADGSIKQLDKIDASGATVSTYILDSFSSDIQESDVVPGADYKKQNMFSFMASMM
ncbi:MAG: hypothetical protein IJ766_03575 [Clostridia bacterium]|nr:hypothetical protein [Clostridia bacterium]